MYYINPLIERLVRISPQGDRIGYLRLDMNENPEGLPQTFVEKCKEKIDSQFLSTYPNRESLINKLSEYHKMPKECLCITDGSEMAIKYIYEVFGEPGKKVITVNPTFEMYGVYCNMFGLQHVTYDIGSDFKINIDDFLKRIDRDTCLVSLLNPNNPVGGIYNPNEILQIVEKAYECDAIVIIDEAYHDFNNVNSIELVKKFDNVIILRTFSKLFSMAACRIGYALACPQISNLLNRVRPTFDTNSFALLFAENILENKKMRDYLIQIEQEGRSYLLDKLQQNGYEYYYGGGNYIFIKPKNDIMQVIELLYKNKVLVKCYGKGILREYIRINTGSKKVMKQFWDIFTISDMVTD